MNNYETPANPELSFTDKLKAMIKSRRFWISVIGVLAVVNHDLFGLPEEQTQSLAAIILAWVLGDSIKTTR